MYSSSRERRSSLNIWPGFVDALTALIMVMIFVVLVFVISQYYLSSALKGSNKTLAELSQEMQKVSILLERAQRDKILLQGQAANLQRTIENQKAALQDAQAEQEKLNQFLATALQQREIESAKNLTLQEQMAALKRQLEELNLLLAHQNSSLSTTQERNAALEKEIADLSERLTQIANSREQKLAQYQSEFFGRLKEALANRTDIKVVGDRFMFQSEVLFESASATLEEKGKKQLEILANSLKEIAATLPEDLNWVLRIDGHTDQRPIHTSQFQSNWELSAARAISVVNFLISKDISPKRLAAAGFAEFQPLVQGKNADRNRRIELKIDQR